MRVCLIIFFVLFRKTFLQYLSEKRRSEFQLSFALQLRSRHYRGQFGYDAKVNWRSISARNWVHFSFFVHVQSTIGRHIGIVIFGDLFRGVASQFSRRQRQTKSERKTFSLFLNVSRFSSGFLIIFHRVYYPTMYVVATGKFHLCCFCYS